MSECPCINCVCIPICRCKFYSGLLNDCELISRHTWSEATSSRRFAYRIIIRDVLKPTEWEVDSDGIFVDPKFPPLSV